MSNVQKTESEPRALDLSDAADAILNRWEDAEKPSEDEEVEATTEDVDETDVEEVEIEEAEELEDDEEYEADPDEEEDTEDQEEEDDDDEDEEDDDTTEEVTIASDDTVVEIKVNGETKQVSVKDLKRLAGQEASLTRKSQDLADQRKITEEDFVRTTASYQKLLDRAKERLKPYADMDMMVAQSQMDTETFAQLRQDARQAEEDVKFLEEESHALLQDMQVKHQSAVQAAAKECIRVLEDTIPDWGNEMYNDIRAYAVKNGLPQNQVDQYTDPNVIMLINKARLYDETKATAQVKKAKAKVTKKTKKTKVLSSKKSPPTKTQIKKANAQKAQEKLRNNPKYGGGMDDIADALMARWES
tara:strand:+ start:60 stop:1136 length:1077 start_codon:yes stop_codon:yes gene_type:complete